MAANLLAACYDDSNHGICPPSFHATIGSRAREMSSDQMAHETQRAGRHKMWRRLMLVAGCLTAIAGVMPAPCSWGQTREEKVRGDREKVESDGFWIYNDLPRAFREAEQTGKPIIVVLRCIPCEECVKLDDDLVDSDPSIRPLLEQFVRARQVSTNGLDLDLFQYDTDQSFAVFLLNADGTIYGRFGTRSHRTEWLSDVSLPGMAKALEGALALHADYPANQAELAGKRGKPLEVSSPEQYPALKDKYSDRLDYRGDVVKSCIHCHQIGEAQRSWYRDAGQPIPEEILYPYPHPKIVGLTLDPHQRATVTAVAPDSAAAAAGVIAGDQIASMNGQPLLSIADLQWILHRVPASGSEITLTVNRDGEKRELTLAVDEGWRRAGDLSWRVSTWSLRRMGAGGMVLAALTADQRKSLGINAGEMALEVKRVGQYGPHAAAKRAGFQVGDVLRSYHGQTDLVSEADLLRYAVTNTTPGQQVDVALLRDGSEQILQLPMQN